MDLKTIANAVTPEIRAQELLKIFEGTEGSDEFSGCIPTPATLNVDEPTSAIDGFFSVTTVPSQGELPKEGEPKVIYITEDSGITWLWVDGNYVPVRNGMDAEEVEVPSYEDNYARFMMGYFLKYLKSVSCMFDTDDDGLPVVKFADADFLESTISGFVLMERDEDVGKPYMVIPIMRLDLYLESPIWDRHRFEMFLTEWATKKAKKAKNIKDDPLWISTYGPLMVLNVPYERNGQDGWELYSKMTNIRDQLTEVIDFVEEFDRISRHRFGYHGHNDVVMARPWYVYGFDAMYGYERIIASCKTERQAQNAAARLLNWPARFRGTFYQHKNDFFKDTDPEDYGNFCPE